jgi:N-methylhydantoinase A/oxoprolinase/acetone carboxylase beta subunit
LRVGIDVGGTFTKAVALRFTPGQPIAILAQSVVPTTHRAATGVAAGVIAALRALLAEPTMAGQPVAIVAHSTTQAVNALLEGDVTPVGIIAFGPARAAARMARLVTPGLITLAPGRTLRTGTIWLDTPLQPAQVARAVADLAAQGMGAMVASGLFGNEDPAAELQIIEAAQAAGLPAVGGHQVTGSYGLEVRTTTAAINASILPRMMATSDQIAACLRDAGITAPLLIMRGDGGAMAADALRTRPILSLLSGPAASVTGALLDSQVVFGLFIEVGGTSTNIAVIRDGEPTLDYVRVMDHPTCIRSLDVRVQGVAGGSLIRVRGGRVQAVGPRSAHIAGIPYLSFSQPSGTLGARLVAPGPGDPADYLVLRDAAGNHYGLTVTCAAAALGRLDQSAGSMDGLNPAAALAGFAALGRLIGLSPEQAAEAVLNRAARQIGRAVAGLARAYRIKTHQVTLIGGGGGAPALVPAVAAALDAPYQIAPHASIISSIGVALALIREEVEHGAGAITPDQAATEAHERAVQAGAAPGTIQVTTETIPERGIIRAVATGALRLAADSTPGPGQAPLPLDSLRRAVALRVETSIDAVDFTAQIGRFAVFSVRRWGVLRGRWAGTVIVTDRGLIKVAARGTTPALIATEADRAAALAVIKADSARNPTRRTVVQDAQLITFGGADAGAAAALVATAGLPFAIIVERLSWL